MPTGDYEPSEPRPEGLIETFDRIARTSADISGREAEFLVDRDTVLDWHDYGYFSYVILDKEAPESIRNTVIAFDLGGPDKATISDCGEKDLSVLQRIGKRFGKAVAPEIVSTGSERILSEAAAHDLLDYIESIRRQLN